MLIFADWTISVGVQCHGRRIKLETVKRIAAYLGLMVVVSVLSVSCYREEDFNLKMMANNQDVNYDLAVPLFETRLTIANLLSVFGRDENFPTGSDGLVHLVYALEKPLRFDIGNRISIPNLSLGSFELAAVPYWKNDTVISVTQRDTIVFDIRGLEAGATIDRIVLDSVNIALAGSYGLGLASTMDIVFGNIRRNGQPLELHLNLEKGASLAYRQLFEDVEIVFDGEFREKPRVVYEVRFRADLNTAENEYPDVRTGRVQMRPALDHIIYKRIEGYIGKFAINNFFGTLDVSLLENLNVEDISFYEATVDVASNLTGCSVPIFINESDLTCVFFSGEKAEVGMFPENYTLPYPEPTAAVLEKSDVQKIDIRDLLAHKPKKFTYLIDATLNGGENNEVSRNVIERESGLAMDIACDIPMHMAVSQFIVDDTLPFSSLEQMDMIKRFFLKGIVTNAFPLEVYMHLDFLDASGNVLFSPVDGDTIDGGRVENLHVVEPAIYRLDTELTSDEVAMLGDTKYIRVWANVSTYKKGEVKIYANSDTEGFLRVKLGARAMLRAGGLLGGAIGGGGGDETADGGAL